MESSNKLLRRALFGSAIILALALAGCGEADEGSAEPGIGTFSIEFSTPEASTKGTVYPDLTGHIDHYKVAYDNGDGIKDEKEFAGDAEVTLSLPAATYTFTVTAYADDLENVVLATAEIPNVVLPAETNLLAVTMTPSTDAGTTGTFEWEIVTPPDANSINLIIDNDSYNITTSLDSTKAGLSVGFHTYQVVGLDGLGEPVYHYAGYVYIYPDETGLVSKLVLAAADFSPGGYKLKDAVGSITVTLTLGYDVPHYVTLSEDGTTLSVTDDYTDCTWSINGKVMANETGTSFTLPETIKPGDYTVCFTGEKDGKTYSDFATITVETTL